MRNAAVLVLALIVPSVAGCQTLANWFAEMATWRTGAGHSRQEMVDEYNSDNAAARSDRRDGQTLCARQVCSLLCLGRNERHRRIK